MSLDATVWAMNQTAGDPIAKALLMALSDHEVVVGDHLTPGLISPRRGETKASLLKHLECSPDQLRQAFVALRDRELFEVIEPPNDWPYSDDKKVWHLMMPSREVR